MDPCFVNADLIFFTTFDVAVFAMHGVLDTVLPMFSFINGDIHNTILHTAQA